jgi:uncharacterized protein (DUF488 family)
MPELFTLGYEGLTQDAYFDIVQATGVETLVDVRRTPLSRKPGLSKKRLGETADARGMRYVHMVDLGTPHEILYAYRENRNRGEFMRRYGEYLDSQDAALQHLADLATRETCCLMCVEADPSDCHRFAICERIEALWGVGEGHIVHLCATK